MKGTRRPAGRTRPANPANPPGQTGTARRRPSEAPVPGPGLPLAHPASLATLTLLAVFAAALVTHQLLDPDLWEHLAIGRVIWERRAIPATHEWTWPSWGKPDVMLSWLFRALLWPFWEAGHAWGLQAWRWLATIGAFALAIATGRRLGARGLLPLLGAMLAALVLRQRTQVRPETLTFVLAALQLWLLETRRQGGPDRRWALPLVALLWANVHASWWMGLAFTALFAAEAAWRGGRDPAARGEARALAGWLALSALASFVNPFGWRALAQPFEYQFVSRNDPLYRTIAELGPVRWREHLRDGGIALFALWPALAIVRARRRGADLVEWTLMLAFGALAMGTQRFLGMFAIVSTPYVMRGLSEAAAGLRAPPPAARAALTVLAAAALVAPELSREDLRFGPGIETRFLPEGAAEFMAREDLRGRGFNAYWQAGWLLWRFPGERDRLPFMDTQQTGSAADRARVAALGADPGAFRALEDEWRFDWLLWPRHTELGGQLADQLDSDPAWTLVFADDASLLWVKAGTPLAARAGFAILPAGTRALAELGRRCEADTSLAAATAAELRVAIARSPAASSMSRSVLASLELQSAHWGAALAQLDTVRASRTLTPFVEERRAVALLELGRPDEALSALAAQRRQTPGRAELEALESAARDSLSARGR